MSSIVLDVNNMLATNLDGRGIDPAVLEGGLAARFKDAQEVFERLREDGSLGFLDLPYAHETARQVQELADGFGQWFEDLVVLGIGGSALGTRCLRDALLGPLWNERDGEDRDHFPRIHVLDNVDPTTISPFLERIDLRRSLFNVVSKSGSTAETMAQFLVVSGLLKEELGDDQARGHLLFTTSQDSGALRQIADAAGVPSLPVPENVGGRFSVLSPVGLLPAAVTGIDITELLAGAAEMEERCRSPELLENPAGLIATLLHSAATELGMPIHVMMPYSDRLRSFALWFQQIWAESLGKIREKGDEERHIGPTPLPAVGATDQHSQLQLFMDGPRDKVVLFLAVERTPDPVAIPELHPEMPGLSYLGGHTLGELLSVERRATTEALRQRGRPSMNLEVEELTAHTLGGLFMLFEVATVFAGALYGIDPLSQPGVELCQELTYGLLGRDGYPAPTLRTGDPRWRV